MSANPNIKLNIQNLRVTAASPAEGRAFEHGFSLALQEGLKTLSPADISGRDLSRLSLRITAGGLPSHQGYRAGMKLAAQLRGRPAPPQKGGS